jgi:hypothetical protein
MRHRAPDFHIGWAIAAAIVAAVNCHLAFVRPTLFRLRHGSMENYRYVSGFPLFGEFFACMGGGFGFGEVVTALVGITSMLLNPNSLLWFTLLLWNDESFWGD